MAEWISVNDRLPKNNLARVLVYLKDDEFTSSIGFSKIDTDRCIDGKWARWGEHVTHWMMLPPPPRRSYIDVLEYCLKEADKLNQPTKRDLSDGCKECVHSSVCYEIENLKCRTDFIWYQAESGCPHYTRTPKERGD